MRTAFALLLVALVAATALQGFAPHTDDGCRTEIHCQACRHGLASLAVVESLSDSGPHLRLDGGQLLAPESMLVLRTGRPRLVRGPPAA